MAVKIGSARSDEWGGIYGGNAGDQKQKTTPDYNGEVSMQNWYLHSKGWRVFRCKDPEKAEKIAWDMIAACDNPLIGYDQEQDQTLYQVSKPLGFNCAKVATPCETDCARLVRVCVLYAGINVDDFYTGSEAEMLMRTGQFRELTDTKYTTGSEYLQRGDILVTKTQGHTVVVLNDGSKVISTGSYDFGVSLVKKGVISKSVLLCQKLLKVNGYKGANGRVLTLDGECGDNTVYAINSFQTAMRKKGIECGDNGKNDGECGRSTWTALLDL